MPLLSKEIIIMVDNKSVNYAFKGNEEILEHYRKDGYTNEQLMGVATVYNKLNSFDDRCKKIRLKNVYKL